MYYELIFYLYVGFLMVICDICWANCWANFHLNIMENKATIKIMPDTRSMRKDGTHPIKLRVLYLRDHRYFGTGIAVSPEDWEKIASRKARGQLKEVQSEILAIESKAQAIIDSIGAFTFKRFQDAYNGIPSQETNDTTRKLRLVYDVFEVYVADVKAMGRAGTAASYKDAMTSFRKFADKLYFEDVTPAFLRKYEQARLDKGNSLTTIGMHVRALRAIFNYAIEKGIVQATFYPFGKRKYQIPKGANVKKALVHADVMKIANYTPQFPDLWEEQARDLWLFSYVCNGMNIKDVCNLKYKNIDVDKLVFTRQKTEHTMRSNPKSITAYLPEKALEIIERWGTKPENPDSYVFPFYEMGMDAERKLAVSKQIIQNINKWMKYIGKELGINAPITTYTARHTFSTVLKRSGASVEFISESLGHSDLKTTENYLAGFEDEHRKEMSKKLLG